MKTILMPWKSSLFFLAGALFYATWKWENSRQLALRDALSSSLTPAPLTERHSFWSKLSDDERIDEASLESFPASDPPNWTH